MSWLIAIFWIAFISCWIVIVLLVAAILVGLVKFCRALRRWHKARSRTMPSAWRRAFSQDGDQ